MLRAVLLRELRNAVARLVVAGWYGVDAGGQIFMFTMNPAGTKLASN